ncbi:hypothetical protein GCM10011521_06020 [Arenimonas soli]|uniref:Uncharacterized protein n=1 Tax=Arenimonas soli TaxID=2269504 RepID=A0ABQ1HDB0_9GAMM|nr:hypothetical protein [Arenimonas soli]GGA70724.1 hypothetical protein GCM10011521_06020 [Arenimonas soli]
MDTNNSTAKLTTAVGFDDLPVEDEFLMEVRAGLDVDFAERKASCLEGSVRRLLHMGVGNNGLDADTLFLCSFALETASALRQAAGQEA